MIIRIKENSVLAKLAAKRLKVERVAMVLGKTIHLHNTTKEQFLQNKKWLTHEAVHVQQYQQHGFFKFLFLYLMESLKKGYWNNRFEVEAREKEHEESITKSLEFK
jgi:hypothetical protein